MAESNVSKDTMRSGAPFAALSYVAFLSIITFIFKKENEFAVFHARQGLVLFFAKFVCFVMPLFPFISRGFSRFFLSLSVAASLYGIYCALTGKIKSIPIIGTIARRLVI